MTLPAEPDALRAARSDAVFVFALYAVAVLTYAVLGRTIAVPVIFPDEFTYGHIAQSLANGDGVSWNGQPENLRSLLYVLAIAPSWVVSSGESAYDGAKIVNAVLASLVVVPVWLLARSLSSPRLAVAAAVLSVAGTWMLTTGYLLSESLAYPLAVASLAAMVTSLRRPGSRWWMVALGLAAVAAYARLQLVGLVPILFLALVLDAARFGRSSFGSRALAQRTPLLVTGGASALGFLIGIAAPDSLGIYSSVRHFSPGIGDILGASGQHALGLLVLAGFLPFAAALALALRPANWRDEATGPLLAVLVCAVVVFVLQAGWFGAGFHLKWDIERYVEYVAPLALVALVLAPGRISWRTGLAATGGLSLCLLLTNAASNRVEQRAVLGSTHRLGQLLSPFADHPALGLAVAGALIGAAGVALLAGRRSHERPDRAALAAAGLVLVVLVVQSQTSWHREEAITKSKRASQPTDLGWVDHAARGDVGILNTGLDNPSLYVTELLNEKIDRGRYHTVSGLTATGPICVLSVERSGLLRGPTGCEPPRTLLVESAFVKATFQNGRTLADNPPNSRLIDTGPGPPRLLSLLSVPCVDSGTPFEGSSEAVRPCRGRLDIQLWLDAPGTVSLRFRGGTAQHYARVAGAADANPLNPGEDSTVRIPAAEGPSTIQLELDWGSTDGAPTLEAVQLRRGEKVASLL